MNLDFYVCVKKRVNGKQPLFNDLEPDNRLDSDNPPRPYPQFYPTMNLAGRGVYRGAHIGTPWSIGMQERCKKLIHHPTLNQLILNDCRQHSGVYWAGGGCRAGVDKFVWQEGCRFSWCVTKQLSEHCSSSTTVVGYDLFVSHTKLWLTVL